MAPQDLPNPDRYKSILEQFDLTKFPDISAEKQVKIIDDILAVDLPRLMSKFENPYM